MHTWNDFIPHISTMKTVFSDNSNKELNYLQQKHLLESITQKVLN